jgi:phosphoribosylanthranilate isomerase
MNHTRVKICGITSLEDARFCAGAGADYLGFIQHADSPRYIAPAQAGQIIEWVHGSVPVGVFVNADAETINSVCDEAGFEMAQLHGHEPPEVVDAVEVPVIKAFSVQHDASSEQLRALMDDYRGLAEYFLLDTHHTSLWGGTGESFNWRVARELAAEFPLFLAGGISAENVREAIETMRPHAVDLSSSVESSPGVKDFDRITRFFDAFREVAHPDS